MLFSKQKSKLLDGMRWIWTKLYTDLWVISKWINGAVKYDPDVCPPSATSAFIEIDTPAAAKAVCLFSFIFPHRLTKEFEWQSTFLKSTILLSSTSTWSQLFWSPESGVVVQQAYPTAKHFFPSLFTVFLLTSQSPKYTTSYDCCTNFSKNF